MICDNIKVSEEGQLLFAGQNTIELAKKYGTPLYLLDEDKLREKCNIYKKAFDDHFNGLGGPLYASKANCFKRIYEIMREENMGIDVVSSGEIYTALQAGFDLSNAFFHSNNKTDEDIIYAIENGIGYFVADNIEEIKSIAKEAEKRKVKQKVLLRLTPGIDTHTYEAVSTGKVDSKFGSAIETGQAEEITANTLKEKYIDLQGFHCHLGSQIFAEDVFERGAEIMIKFIFEMYNKYGLVTEILDLGGGYGVKYTELDPDIDIYAKIGEVAKVVKTNINKYGIEMPQIHMEPGRSIIADAGMTLYKAGTVKKIQGYKNYLSVDGGMPDNPRFALYGSEYTCYVANKMNEESDFGCSIVGRCCESGDIIQENVIVPNSVTRDDIVAVCTTGAYNYSMASNYNRLRKLPTIMLSKGKSYIGVRRQSYEEMCCCDV